MRHTASVALLLSLLSGCESPQVLSHAGTNAAAGEYADFPPATTRRLQAGTDYQVAPLWDGRSFVVTDWNGDGDLAIQDLVTGELRRLTHNTASYEPGYAMHPRVSPDGKRAVYTWDPAQIPDGPPVFAQLRTIGLDGSGETVVYDEPATWVRPEDWSQDGRTILALRQMEDRVVQIVTIPAAGGTPTVVRTLDWRWPSRMNFSPDGRFIAYDYPTREASNQDRDIFVLDLVTGSQVELVKHPAEDRLLGWAPDGRHVLFSSDRSGTPGAWVIEVAEGRPVGNPVLVRPELWQVSAGAFTPDGAYYYAVTAGSPALFTASLDPRTGALISPPARLNQPSRDSEQDPRWSPDGRSIASRAGNSTQGWSVVIRSVETGESREFPLPAAFAFYRPPMHQWSPDGRSLLIRARDRTGYGLHRMDVQSGKLETLFTLPGNAILGLMHLTPDGRTLRYLAVESEMPEERTGSVVERDLASGSERVLCRRTFPGGSWTSGLYDALSPDGSARAIFTRNGDGQAMTVRVETSEDLCASEARTLVELPNVAGAYGVPVVAWGPESRTLYFQQYSGDTREMWRVSLDGGEPQRTGLAAVGLRQPIIDASGRRVVYLAGGGQNELWVMEGLFPASQSVQ